jgi:hypothetical protein
LCICGGGKWEKVGDNGRYKILTYSEVVKCGFLVLKRGTKNISQKYLNIS